MVASGSHFEILVLGGGPAGASAARTIAAKGRSVAIVERSKYERFLVGETLPPEANSLIARIKTFGSLGDDGHLPSPGTVAAWGSDHPHENDFIFSPFGHGWHLDRRRFDESLAESAVAAGATMISGTQAISCKHDDRSRWHVNLSTPEGIRTLTSEWIIDATGRSGWFTHSQGVQRHSYDRLIAIIGILEDPEQNDPRTFIEAMPDGWWYVSALPNHRTIAAFFTDSDLHELRAGQAKTLWTDRRQKSRLANERLGGIRLTDEPRVLTCSTGKLARSTGKGWLAIGDAARAIDPLSSQGISWAITSALDAASAILAMDPAAAAAQYQSTWDNRFQEYLDIRQSHYSSERRWLDSAFWQRRLAHSC